MKQVLFMLLAFSLLLALGLSAAADRYEPYPEELPMPLIDTSVYSG